MKNRREKKAQPWFPGTPNILLPNRHPEDGVRRGERRPAGQIVEDLAYLVKDFMLHPKGVVVILGTPA